jgi:hypothetical protein
MPRLTAPLSRPWPWALAATSIIAAAAMQTLLLFRLLRSWADIIHTRFPFGGEPGQSRAWLCQQGILGLFEQATVLVD